MALWRARVVRKRRRASLIPSREEIQLIRDYIKPARLRAPATEPIKVGDPATGETVPSLLDHREAAETAWREIHHPQCHHCDFKEWQPVR